MANFIYSILSQSVIKSAGHTTTGVDAAYPVSNMLDLTRFRLCTRSTNTTAPVIYLDLTNAASDPTIGGFTLENVNFGSLLIEGATSAASGTWNWNGTGQTISPTGTDPDDNRRKIYVVPTTTFTRRYMRITPSALDAGATYYQFGSLGCWPTVTTLAKNFSRPYEKSIEDEAEEGVRQIGVPAAIRVRMNLSARMAMTDSTANSQLRELVTAPRNRVVMLYENEGTTTKFYHMRRDASARITRSGDGTNVISGLQFREVG